MLCFNVTKCLNALLQFIFFEGRLPEQQQQFKSNLQKTDFDLHIC